MPPFQLFIRVTVRSLRTVRGLWLDGERLSGGRRFGVSYWGERFGANPAQALECLIRRAAPAHTLEHVVFEEAP